MSISSIQGELLEVTVIGCNKLKDTEWISRQDPYVCLEYGSTKYRTRTHTDGGKDPVFQEKYAFTMIEGLRELNIVVWNSNIITHDAFIGTGKVRLQKVLSEGFDDNAWTINTKNGMYAGEVRLMLKYSRAREPVTSYVPSAPPYGLSHSLQVPQYPPSTASYSHPPTSYPAPPSYPAYPPSPTTTYPPEPASYLPPYASPPLAYPTANNSYPPPYPSPPLAYPTAPDSYPPPYASTPLSYPPDSYPPPHASPASAYPPAPYPYAYPQQHSGSCQGAYPPPAY